MYWARVADVRGGDTYNPDNVNILHYSSCRGFVNKVLFNELSTFRIFCFSPLFPSATRIGVAGLPFFFLSLLIPSILCHSNLVKLLSTAMKSLRIFRKLSKIFNLTRPLKEHRFEWLSKSWRRGNWQRRRTRGSSVQRLSSLISLPKWTGGKLAQAPG